jgi:CBS domain containing-hemolysin-like protein
VETNILPESIYIVTCIFLSGFFSASETALTSLNEIKVKHMISENKKAEKYLRLWLEHPNKVLNTILIGNNIVNILGSVIAADLANSLFKNSAIAITTGIMTLLILVFGEITPKTFAKHNAETLSPYILRILKIFYIVFYPFSFLLNNFVKILIRFMGGKIKNEGPSITEDELEFMIEESGKEGVIEDQQKEMLQNIFDIGETFVKEIMVSRIDMMAIDEDLSLNEILDIISESEYSRIPFYKDNLDNVTGILYVKDLLKYLKKDKNEIQIKTLLRKPTFVPENKKIDDLLKEFQQDRVHLAIVIDEYGSVAGLVTLEDILEEIVGEIRDEYDNEQDQIIEIRPNVYSVDSRIDIDDFCEFFKIEKTESMEEYETFGGLIYDLAGKIPEEGCIFEYENLKFKVLETYGRKLGRIEVKISEKPEKKEENTDNE